MISYLTLIIVSKITVCLHRVLWFQVLLVNSNNCVGEIERERERERERINEIDR